MSSVLNGSASNPLAVVGVLLGGVVALLGLWLRLGHRSRDRDMLRRTAAELADRGAADVVIRYGPRGKDEVRYSGTALGRPLPSETGGGASVVDLDAWRTEARRRRPGAG